MIFRTKRFLVLEKVDIDNVFKNIEPIWKKMFYYNEEVYFVTKNMTVIEYEIEPPPKK